MKKKSAKERMDNPIAGKKIAITGDLRYFKNKEEAEWCINFYGGALVSPGTKGLDYAMVDGQDAAAEASRQGAAALDEEGLLRMGASAAKTAGMIEALSAPLAKLALAELRLLAPIPAWRLLLSEEVPTREGTKIGGLPYWPKGMAPPQAADGGRLALLAQLNMADFQGDARLPKAGLLQFFIQPGDSYGASFDDPTSQSGFRIVFHPSTDKAAEEDEALMSMFFLAKGDGGADDGEDSAYICEYWDAYDDEDEPDEDRDGIGDEDVLPCFGEASLRTERMISVPALDSPQGERMARRALADKGILLSDAAYREVVCHADDEGAVGGCRLFGCMYSPHGHYGAEKGNALLLQLDSMDLDDSRGLEFGDMGWAHFLVPKTNLDVTGITEAWYGWECY